MAIQTWDNVLNPAEDLLTLFSVAARRRVYFLLLFLCWINLMIKGEVMHFQHKA